jgi:hypothetical protein
MRYGISILLAGTVTCVFSLSAAAQSPSTNSGDSHRIVPFKESLQARGIGLSHASLAAALRSNDPKVRSQAAAVLAENHDPEAASLIKDALAFESDPKTQAELAGVLMNLGDTTGMNRLTQMCTDPSLPDQTLSYAVFHLAVRGSGAQCIDELIKRLRDPSKLEGAMHLIQPLGPLYQRGFINATRRNFDRTSESSRG